MTNEALLGRLHQHHDEILHILSDAESMLTDMTQRDIPGLARARWTLMRELTSYQMLVQAKLLDPLIQRGASADADRAQRLKQAGAEAVSAFRGNVTKWSATDVAAVWPTYQASALAMIARLRDHVARARREFAALASAIPRQAVAPPRPGPPTPVG